MKKNKKILFVLSIASTGLIIGLVSGHGSFESRLVAEDIVCKEHSGYHYAEIVPTETTSGHREFWTCCKCHESWLTKPSEGVFTDASDTVMTGGFTDAHIAYLPTLVTPFGLRLANDLSDALSYGYTTVVAQNDLTLTEEIVLKVNKELTLDLNGHTISRSSDKAAGDALFTNNGTMTITSSVEGGTMEYVCSAPSPSAGYGSNTISNCGTLTIDSDNVTIVNNTTGSACYAVDNNSSARKATLTIDGGSFISKGNSSIRMFANGTTTGNDVTINGGFIEGNYYGLRIHNTGVGSKLNALVTGGEFKSTQSEYNYNVSMFSPEYSYNGVISITGGKFNDMAADLPAGVISGGTWAVNPIDFVASDYKVVENDDGTFTVVKCDHKTIVYELADDLSIKGICPDCLKEHTVESADELEDKVLVKNATTGYYEITSDTLRDVINKAATDATVDVLLGAGNYNFADASSSGVSHSNVTVNIHGFVLDGDKQTHLDDVCFVEGKAIYTTITGVTLNIDHIIMEGRKDYNLGWYSGIQSDKFIATDCDFLGGTTVYANVGEFYNCTFDSTMIANKADYAIYFYNGKGIVDNCSFVTAGKAIKIYSEGNTNGEFIISNCTFTIGEELITSQSDKAAVQIDSTFQTVNPYVVYVNGCEQTGYVGGLVADSSTHSKILIDTEPEE